MRLIFSLLLFFSFVPLCQASTNWYVRDGGGTGTQCTGKVNAVYPGSGTAQPCAFNNPSWALGYHCGYSGLSCQFPGVIAGGDTVFINGDSDITSGAQAQYEIGFGSVGMPGCVSGSSYDCTLGNMPAGVSGSPTGLIGTGSHRAQLWSETAVQGAWQTLNADNNFLVLSNLEITDHTACAYSDPTGGCNNTQDGMFLGGNNVTLNNVYEHGLGHFGILTDNFGNITFNNVWIIGNGYGGMSTGTAAVGTGTLTFNQPIIEWNGCIEAYPLTNAGIDNSANYSNCFGQNNGGYGDGLAFGNDGFGNAGNWIIQGPGSISFNVQDGLDTLHGAGNGTIQIDKMRFEGNAGNQVKMNALNESLTNSIIIGNCGVFYQAPWSLSGGMGNGDSCRAEGNVILFNVENGSTTRIYNNTIISNGDDAMVSEDVAGVEGQPGGCNGTTSISVMNNVFYGGYFWGDDTSFGGTSNSLTNYLYNSGNDFDGGGTCGSLTWTENYNIVTGFKNSNQGCVGANDKCGTSPGFQSAIPVGTSGGGRTTYYTGTSGVPLMSIAIGSAAKSAGVTGLIYWKDSNDYYNLVRPSPPSMGAEEYLSCASLTYGCQFGSDCCSGSCTNNSCAGSCAGLGTSCTLGSQCCTGICSGGICVASSCTSTGGSCSASSSCCSGICCSSICSLSCGGSPSIIDQTVGQCATVGKTGF